jgi:iron complex outermembrane receptor protein
MRRESMLRGVEMELRILALLLIGGFSVRGQEHPAFSTAGELKKYTLEELLNQEVTSASKRPEPLTKVATAIEVIDSEEIRRSGATTIPDILRLATGLHVAQADGHTWAVSARGFNTTVANKMQVLIDGRNLYSPLFSGVFWDVQHYLLDDIDRIEVIRGPGAALWGANAFNGVINIITKSARDTQGGLLMGGGGTEENGFGGFRYGSKFSENTFYRVYATYFNRDGLKYPSGADAHDGMMQGQTGFRTDSYLQGANVITVQGDYYNGLDSTDKQDDTHVTGGNLLGRWSHTFSETSDLQAQLYYDRTYRNIPQQFREDLGTYDLDFQHRFDVGERNHLMYGFEYRLYEDDIDNPNPTLLAFVPPERNMQLVSGFLQDEINIVPDYFGVTVGSKFEHNDFTGFEFQPSIRAAYFPAEGQTLWAGVSRAVRTPTRIDEDFVVPSFGLTNEPPGLFRSEEVIAYELGYRLQLWKRVSFDLTGFYNDYDNLRSVEPMGGFLVERNELEGDGYGFEISSTFQATDSWRLRGGYRYLETRLHGSAASKDPLAAANEANDPHNIVTLTSMLNLPWKLEFDQIVRYVDNVPPPFAVAEYLALDLRLAWSPRPNLELAVVGRNLLDNQHPEIGAPTALRKEVERSVYGKVTWRF